MKSFRCEMCGAIHTIKFNTDILTQGELKLSPYMKVKSVKDNTLLHALLNYWRWCAEGKPPYGNSIGAYNDKNKFVGQYYYDPYHESIDFNKRSQKYTFSIQTSDSPEGDTWWEGNSPMKLGNLKY